MSGWTISDLEQLPVESLRRFVAAAPELASEPSIARRLAPPRATETHTPPSPTVVTPLQPGSAPILSESAWQQTVIDLARANGWSVFAVLGSRNHARVTHVGWPDLILWRPPHLIAAELKTPSGRLTPEQARTLIDLARCGVDVRIWTPTDEPEIHNTLTGA